jgi:DNA-binding CsgD family transcriptional regulator
MTKPKRVKIAPTASEAGLVLFDRSLKPIAFDRGAAGILNFPRPPTRGGGVPDCVPSEMLKLIGFYKSTIRFGERTRVHAGEGVYLCRAYLMESSSESLANPVVAVHMEKVWSAKDAVEEISTRFLFTVREREVLSGISRGLTGHEIAAQLNLSPHTVRSFIRLIMTKMGVVKRSEVVSALLKSGRRHAQQLEDENT